MLQLLKVKNMNKMNVINCCISLCLVGSLCVYTEARYVRRVAGNGGTAEMETVKCMCSVWAELYDDSPYHAFGVIQTFQVSSSETPTSPICHHIKHQCKKECELRTDLGVTVENTQPLGLKLCQKFGIDTKRGGASMVSHARLEGQGCGLDENQNEAFLARVETLDERLCCGHTHITKDGKLVELFGWNPDCNTREFIFV